MFLCSTARGVEDAAPYGVCPNAVIMTVGADIIRPRGRGKPLPYGGLIAVSPFLYVTPGC